MAKGASGSQAATLVPRAGGASTGGSAAARAPPTAAGLRKRTSKSTVARGHNLGFLVAS